MVHIWVTAHIWARVCQVSTYLDKQTRLGETTTGRTHSHAGVHIWMHGRGWFLAGVHIWLMARPGVSMPWRARTSG